MIHDDNADNPYAPPEMVEDDTASYDLLKIGWLYHRLGAVLKWFVTLLIIDFFLFGFFLTLLGNNDFSYSTTIFYVILRIGMTCVVVAIRLTVILLFFYGVFMVGWIAYVMKNSIPAMAIILLCAIIFPFTIFIMILMRRKAAQILRDGGIEIINGKVDLAKIPQDNDY